MSQGNIFVGRATELHRLDLFLAKAASGQAQVVFIAGEAGAGKSALVNEFVRRAEDAGANVISATGECNAQTGAGDPYLPFRQMLTALTVEIGRAHVCTPVTSGSRMPSSA